MRWDFFHRPDSPNGKVQVFVMDLPADTAEEALALAYKNHLPKGSYRSGCFEIQSDRGIWQHAEEKRIDFSIPCRSAKVTFTSWE